MRTESSSCMPTRFPLNGSMMSQTISRRKRQDSYNQIHGIVPKTIQKALPTMGEEESGILAGTAGKGAKGGKRFVGKTRSKKGVSGLAQKFSGSRNVEYSDSVLDNVSQPNSEVEVETEQPEI